MFSPPTISQVTLHNFRNQQEVVSYNFELPCVAIIGPNGSGKTSIIEAISLLMPGKGMRANDLSEITNIAALGKKLTACSFSGEEKHPVIEASWEIGISLNLPEDYAHLKCERIVCSFATGSRNKKILSNSFGENIASSSLLDGLRVMWLSPESENIYQENSQARRNYVDRMVYAVLPDHAINFRHYNLLLKNRLKALKNQYNDPGGGWMDAMEKQLSLLCLRIAAYRLLVVSRTVALMGYNSRKFAKVEIDLIGEIEDILRKNSTFQSLIQVAIGGGDWVASLANFLEMYGAGGDNIVKDLSTENSLINEIAACYRHYRFKDRVSGRSHFGVQRSRCRVSVDMGGVIKDIEKCSTGEQKIVLTAIFLANVEVVAAVLSAAGRNTRLVLLLDDIFAHLDANYQGEIGNFLGNMVQGTQVIIATCQEISPEFIVAIGDRGLGRIYLGENIH